MPQLHTPRIRYATMGAQLYLAIEGSATQRASLAAEHLAADFVRVSPPRPTIVLDLQGCEYLDSTFAGWMIRLHRQMGQAGGRLVVSRCPETCRRELEVMGLVSLFQFSTMTAPHETRQCTCPDLDLSGAEALEFMLHAHEDLAEVDEHNADVFKPIADMLRTELDKTADQQPNAPEPSGEGEDDTDA